jgi:hypothetical protein
MIFATCIFFSIAVTTFYQLNKRDRYQSLFMLGGSLFALFQGLAWEADTQSILVGILPWCIIASLIVNHTLHMLVVR